MPFADRHGFKVAGSNAAGTAIDLGNPISAPGQLLPHDAFLNAAIRETAVLQELPVAAVGLEQRGFYAALHAALHNEG